MKERYAREEILEIQVTVTSQLTRHYNVIQVIVTLKQVTVATTINDATHCHFQKLLSQVTVTNHCHKLLLQVTVISYCQELLSQVTVTSYCCYKISV